MQRLMKRRTGRSAVIGTVVTVLALLMQVGYVGPAEADDDDELTRITFDERPAQPVNGLRVEGVRFGFRIDGVPSRDARFNAFGPGDTRFITDPSLEGNAAGVLTMRFREETDVVRFGVAVSCFDCVVRPGATVRLFDDDGELIRFARLTTRPFVSFSEARFSFEGDDVARAVIHFNHRRADRFVIDNLIFEGDDEDSEHGDDRGSGSARVGGWNR
jgi:hypothetical protein